MRRFLRFSIRDLLWLTLVVALALGWFVRERQLRAELAAHWSEGGWKVPLDVRRPTNPSN